MSIEMESEAMVHMQSPIAILGMGRSGCSVARFLTAKGIHCVGFDERDVELPADLDMPMRVGLLKEASLANFDRLIVSPGISWQHPALVAARQAGAHLCGDLELFDEHFHGGIAAITGTNGKTTAVTLLTTMLEVLPGGADCGGNIGTPVLDLLIGEAEPRRAVLELSSFQLERNATIRPRWAALLNVQEDHADMHADIKSYAAAKLRLFECQGDGDTAMLPVEQRWDDVAAELAKQGVKVERFGMVDDPAQASAGIAGSGGDAIFFWHQSGSLQSVAVERILARGAHQHLNMAVAAQGAADFGVPNSIIHEAITSFAGLPHRLQALGFHHDRAWYNDSKATNPAAAMAALTGFPQALWICGGLRKGLDLSSMRDVVAGHVAHGFVIGANPEPYVQLLEQAGIAYSIAGEVVNAVRQAAAYAPALPVLLSPAAASQDQFKHYAERGEAFAQAIRSLEPR
ncbi:MAG: UDP-N-acetylmuramoyl-L-alanine--D-glutamate ligase [Mariprofundaceae bacterium]